jgi:hypothetical protein
MCGCKYFSFSFGKFSILILVTFIVVYKHSAIFRYHNLDLILELLINGIRFKRPADLSYLDMFPATEFSMCAHFNVIVLRSDVVSCALQAVQ